MLKRPTAIISVEGPLKLYGLIQGFAKKVFDGPDDSSFVVPANPCRTVVPLIGGSQIRVVKHDQGVRGQ